MAMKTRIRIPLEDIEDARDSDDGFCLACGERAYGGIEPDARNYECEMCGESQVFGAEECVLMGAVE